MDQYDLEEKVFAPLVGKAILTFGQIEYSTLQAIEMLCRETIIKSAAKLQFKARTELLIEILSGRPKAQATDRLVQLLKRSLKCAEKRNLIAHNPLQINVSYQNDAYNHTPQINRYLDKEKKVTLEELHQLCADMEAISDELADAIHGVLVHMYQKPTVGIKGYSQARAKMGG